jgi:hypothetical protein
VPDRGRGGRNRAGPAPPHAAIIVRDEANLTAVGHEERPAQGPGLRQRATEALRNIEAARRIIKSLGVRQIDSAVMVEKMRAAS